MKNKLCIAAFLCAALLFSFAFANTVQVSFAPETPKPTPAPAPLPEGWTWTEETPAPEELPAPDNSPASENSLVSEISPESDNSAEAASASEGKAGSPFPVMPTLAPLATHAPGSLVGVKIGIDPGHQLHGNNDREPVAPGSKETKAKVSTGTYGRTTGVPEHEVNLAVSLQLRDALEALGCTVYMTREVADVDISNVERATMMNELGVDLVLRIHCNGSENKSAKGIGLYVRKTGPQADECERAAKCILPEMVAATGAESDGIFKRDTYSGLNWSEVPSILVEMGFMTNREEDLNLNDPVYQQKLVSGMVAGIQKYMGR